MGSENGHLAHSFIDHREVDVVEVDDHGNLVLYRLLWRRWRRMMRPIAIHTAGAWITVVYHPSRRVQVTVPYEVKARAEG